MKRLGLALFWTLVLAANGIIVTYHAGVFPKPSLETPAAVAPGKWIDKSVYGTHQLVLEGTPFERGLQSGRAVRELLRRQEVELVTKLHSFIPNALLLRAAVLFGIAWFQGIDGYFEPWATDEMYGVSLSAPPEFNDLSDPFTRQVAYHGLHEVGQMMVDQQGDDAGCTVVATPYLGNWILGRNFDFEGGRIFDDEKILKWVFPDQGNPYVSVTWAGMVGVVTGVNSKGLFISINAAGSKDFRRVGTPSTLVVLKALQFANTIDEALKIIERETMFITDIFVVLDAASGRLVRVEKSPRATEVEDLSPPAVVTNHLLAPRWRNDPINVFRQTELTSTYRYERALKLVRRLDGERLGDGARLEQRILDILRDKGGEPVLEIGNRRAIDALIATHSVIYNARERVLYVSHGPSVTGRFTGFDLQASFAAREPRVSRRAFGNDPLVSGETYKAVHDLDAREAKARQSLAHHPRDCQAAARELAGIPRASPLLGSGYWTIKGDIEECEGRREAARANWQKALDARPAYIKDERRLKERLSR